MSTDLDIESRLFLVYPTGIKSVKNIFNASFGSSSGSYSFLEAIYVNLIFAIFASNIRSKNVKTTRKSVKIQENKIIVCTKPRKAVSMTKSQIL